MQGEPGSGQPPAAGHYCTSCGALLDESVRYCPSCGRAVACAAPDVDIAGWFRSGWNLFVNNIAIAIGIPLLVVVPLAVFFFAGYLGFIVTMAVTTGSHHGPSWVALAILGSLLGLLGLIFALVMPALLGGVYACFLQGIRTGALTADGLKVGLRNWWACTWVVWVMQLATLVCIPFAFILVGIPAILAVQTLGWLTVFRIVDKGEGGMEALSFAWNVMRGRFWMLLVFSFLVQILMNAGVAAVYLGVMATVPIGFATFAAAYDALSRKATTA